MKRQIKGAAFATAPFLIASPAHGQRSDAHTGMARASSKQSLSQTRLIAERRRDVVFIKADIGDMDVRNVTGSFTVESDGSGSIYATDIRGSVIIQNDVPDRRRGR